MSSHQTSKDKPRAAKCNHFCNSFDTHNFCPTCREAGKGDDPCVTNASSCNICASFTEEQLTKISHRKQYSKKEKKQKAEDVGSDLLGDNSVESFTGSQADLELAADRLFTSRLALNLFLLRHFPAEPLLALSRLHQVPLCN